MIATGIEALRQCGVPFAEIARQLDVTRGAIYQWDKIPAERMGEIARITGLPPHIQRPDLFPRQPQHATAPDIPNDVDRVVDAPAPRASLSGPDGRTSGDPTKVAASGPDLCGHAARQEAAE